MPGGGDFLVFSSKSTVGLQAKLKVLEKSFSVQVLLQFAS